EAVFGVVGFDLHRGIIGAAGHEPKRHRCATLIRAHVRADHGDMRSNGAQPRQRPAMPVSARTPPLSLLLAGLLALGLVPATAAAQQCSGSRLSATPPAVNFRVDNDLLGGEKQDQGYTNGAMITLVSPNLADYTDDPCLPRLARRVNS